MVCGCAPLQFVVPPRISAHLKFRLNKEVFSFYIINFYGSCLLIYFLLFPSGQLSGAFLVPFSLHRWSSEPSLAHCSLARSSSQPPSSCSTNTTASTSFSTSSSFSQSGIHSFTRTGMVPEPTLSAPPPLRRSESVGRRNLLRHPSTHAPIIPQRDSDYELEPDRGRKRAIDNQYMLL